MPDLQAVRKRNLRALIKEHGGPTQLAKLLGYAGPSYLSQLTGDHKPITEKTARYIEKKAGKPEGWLDRVHATTVPTAEGGLFGRVTLVVLGEMSRVHLVLSPKRTSQLLTFVYECIVDKEGQINPQLVRQLVELIKGE